MAGASCDILGNIMDVIAFLNRLLSSSSITLRLSSFLSRNDWFLLIVKSTKRFFRLNPNRVVGMSILQPGNFALQENHLIDIQELNETSIEKYYVINPLTNRKIEYTEAYSPTLLIDVKDVLVDAESGLLFSTLPERYPILESSFFYPHDIEHSIFPKYKKNLSGNYLVLSGRSFAHWLIEDLPRFILAYDSIRKNLVAESWRIIVPAKRPKYVDDALEILNVPKEVINYCATSRVENLRFVSSNRGSIGTPSLSYLEVLKDFQGRNSHLNIESLDKSEQNRKIFVSRKYAKRNNFQEEKVAENYAMTKGFRVVYLENLHLSQQISLFAEAEEIMGSHGAGLYNSVWCKDAKITELFSSKYQQTSFSSLCEKLNLDLCRIRFEDIKL
jgi:hypothetical protein